MRSPSTAAPPEATSTPPSSLERRGRWWLAISFLFCPCHLPLTLGVLAGVFGGTALGALLRDHVWVAGTVIAATWLAGTARGLVWIRRAERGEISCSIPARSAVR